MNSIDRGDSLILSTAVFPPVEYFVFMARFGRVFVENDEHFNKQTYRNRYIINAANGPLSQVIPVKRNHDRKTKITNVGIDYNYPWQRQYWRAIFAAYNSSAYFLFYQDELKSLFFEKYNCLFQFNMDAMQLILTLLQLDVSVGYTGKFVKNYQNALDMRYNLHPKEPIQVPLKPWEQVFDEKHGFNPRVSILDLLFNKGPESVLYLKEMANQGIQS
ncbi:MAG: WbqC family protein [Bacteroidales bacterium]|nr:WbqC family protein [Bacteroidales bacterium]MCF8328462.1 WbqC family protein [Bacteroidales bacterium]